MKVGRLSVKTQYPNTAKLFVDTVISKEGQEMIKSFSRILDHGGVASALK